MELMEVVIVLIVGIGPFLLFYWLMSTPRPAPEPKGYAEIQYQDDTYRYEPEEGTVVDAD